MRIDDDGAGDDDRLADYVTLARDWLRRNYCVAVLTIWPWHGNMCPFWLLLIVLMTLC
jgi:hypothetical protein